MFISVLASLLALPAFAEESHAGSEGYIVKLSGSTGDGGLLYAGSEAELSDVLQNRQVEYYEPNYAVELAGELNDYYYENQWNLPSISIDSAWNAGLDGKGVVVAVIDTGLYAGHEDFEGTSILKGMNLMDGTGDTDDKIGHGTMVSGIIAAQAGNGLGIAGLADGVSIVPLRCFRDIDEANVLDICRGIYKAVDSYNCDVICMSLGSLIDSRTMRDAVDYAVSRGVIIVAAAGNEGDAEEFYPASYENVVSVGSYGPDGLVSDFSQRNSSVFISAPGAEIYSTYVGDKASYAKADGTSFAAPHVAAVAALVKAYDKSINAEQFMQLLIDTCDDAGDAGWDSSYGYGKLNVQAIMNSLTSGDYKPLYPDIEGHWAEEYIEYCSQNGLLGGMGDGFSPDVTMTRAMLVTVLYRMDGGHMAMPVAIQPFSDVADPTAWYYDAVYWAAANGIVSGQGDGTFAPDSPVTREQLAAMLYRYAGSPALSAQVDLSAFSDAADVHDYGLNAMAWCYEMNIISGSDGMLLPDSGATRAQAAKMITVYHCDVRSAD